MKAAACDNKTTSTQQGSPAIFDLHSHTTFSDGVLTPRQLILRAIEKGVDEIVMGCTHYPFVIPLIKEIVGKDVQVIDPAPAVSRQADRLLAEYDLLTNGGDVGQTRFLTSGDQGEFERNIKQLLNLDAKVEGLRWVGGELRED